MYPVPFIPNLVTLALHPDPGIVGVAALEECSCDCPNDSSGPINFQWGIAIQDLKLGRWFKGRISTAKLKEVSAPFLKKAGSQLFKDYVLFPDMPALRYAEIAPKVRETCAKYDIHCNTGALIASVVLDVGTRFAYLGLSGGNRFIVFADRELAAVFFNADYITRHRATTQFFGDGQRLVHAFAGGLATHRIARVDHGILERGITRDHCALGIGYPHAIVAGRQRRHYVQKGVRPLFPTRGCGRR